MAIASLSGVRHRSPVRRAADFIDSMGVATHIPYTDGGYSNISNIVTNLAYLGISNVRDGISNGYGGSAYVNSYETIASAGVKFMIFPVSGTVSSSDVTSQLAIVKTLVTANPGSVFCIEGPNEINNGPFSYNGVADLAGAITLQGDLYNAIHGISADAAFAGIKVAYFTGYAAGSIGTGPNPYTQAGLADFDTQHPYPNGGTGPYTNMVKATALPNESAPYGPAVYTETGYSTNGGAGTNNVDAAVQSKFILALYLDAFQQGITKTYVYQLMDAYNTGSPQGNDGFGLFQPPSIGNTVPKAAATAIHNFTTIMADAGGTARSFLTSTVPYTLTGMPVSGNSLVLQKSSGLIDIIVWAEPVIWNQSTGSEVAAGTNSVTVNFGATHSTIAVFDPLVGTSAIASSTNASSVVISLIDHPLIVEISLS